VAFERRADILLEERSKLNPSGQVVNLAKAEARLRVLKSMIEALDTADTGLLNEHA
jgi:hypothetical protein